MHYASPRLGHVYYDRCIFINILAKDGSQIDALVMSTTANLAVMHGKPVSRSWSSIKAENVEEKPDVVVKSRTVRNRLFLIILYLSIGLRLFYH